MEKLSRVTDATIDVLRALLDAPGPVWGLALVKASGRPAGSVYPILERLERAGWLDSEWEQDSSRPGPRRRYYTLSEGGAEASRQAVAVRAARTAASKAPAVSAVRVALPAGGRG